MKKSNEFLDSLTKIIEDAKIMVSNAPKSDEIQKVAISIIEGFFFSNLINNYKNNLVEDNLKEFNIDQKDVNTIKKEFEEIFERCGEIIYNGSYIRKIDFKVYNEFKERLKKISRNAYNLLIELEKLIDFGSCEKKIIQLKEGIKKLGKVLEVKEIKKGDYSKIVVGFKGEKPFNSLENKINQIKEESKKLGRGLEVKEIKKGNFVVSIGFEGENKIIKTDKSLREITDFDKVTMNLEEEKKEDFNEEVEIDPFYRNITLKDEKGHFNGEYNTSNNKQYIVAYDEGDIGVQGQVYLIENEKILWKKKLERPFKAFVTSTGLVVVFDLTNKDYFGKIFFFNKKGEKLLEKTFDSNIGGEEQTISVDEKEVVVVTAFPDRSVYLFSLEEKKLLKKVSVKDQKIPPFPSFKDMRK